MAVRELETVESRRLGRLPPFRRAEERRGQSAKQRHLSGLNDFNHTMCPSGGLKPLRRMIVEKRGA